MTVNRLIDELLIKLNRKSTISLRLKQRTQIIICGLNGKNIYRTSAELGIRYETVKKWRTRWTEAMPMLEEASERGIGSTPLKDHELVGLKKKTLTDKQRSGTPLQISNEQKEQIRALACTSPLDNGIQMIRWTHEMLAHVAKSKQIVDQISSRYIGTILKKTQ